MLRRLRRPPSTPTQSTAPVSDAFPVDGNLHRLEIRLQAIQLSPYHAGPPDAPSLTSGPSRRAADMLLSPSPFGSRSATRPRNLPPSPSRLDREYDRAPRGAQGPLDHPAAGHHRKRRHRRWLGAWGQPARPPATITAYHHLQGQPERLPDPGQELAAVALVHPAMPQPRKPPPVQAAQQPHRAVAVADIGRGDPGLADQPQRVDQQVALAAVQPLGTVVAVRPPCSVVLTLWLSRITALGVGRRPFRPRSCSRRAARTCSHRPCCRHSRQEW
jgi:hypothetical protein